MTSGAHTLKTTFLSVQALLSAPQLDPQDNRSSLLPIFLHCLLIYFSLIFSLIKFTVVYGHSITLETGIPL